MKFPNSITSKLPKIGTSIFAVMSQMAHEFNAINLSQGFPDFPISEKLIGLVNENMKKGYNQYAPMPGVPALRQAIAEKIYDTYNVKYNPDTEITITAGATQGLFTAISALIKDEDEVIVFEPAYDSYVPAIKLNGGIPITIRLKEPDYKIDWNEVKKTITHRTKLIIINSPHNPTGAVLDESDMKNLEKITNNTDIIILSDEVYEHIIFDNLRHESVCYHPKLRERSLVMFSFGKTFHATGWKTGYCLAPENLMKEFRKAHQFVVFTCNTPVQHAIAEFLKDKENYSHIGAFYQEKRDYFLKLLKGSGFTPVTSHGTYFQLLNYSKISDAKEMDFATKLTKEHGVAAIPVSVFYNKEVNNRVLRFCFAKSNETLEKAAEKLCKI